MIQKMQVDLLKKMPIFNMSLSSKELFHSNFIAWMIETYPNDMIKVFSDIIKDDIDFKLNDDGVPEVHRERKNKDLTIMLTKDRKIIIENKVKSLPDVEQLERYSKEGGQGTYFILLSLIKPEWLNEEIINSNIEKKWVFLSYESLIGKIKELNISDKYVEDYIEFVSLLVSLADNFTINKKDKIDFFSYQNDYRLMQDIRMHDVYHKSKYYQLKIMLDMMIKGEYSDIENIITWNYFSRGTSSVNAGLNIKLDKKGNDILQLDFQLQDMDLKLYFNGRNLNKFIKDIPKELLDDYFSILPEIISKYNFDKTDVYPTKSKKDPLEYGLNSYGVDRYYKRIQLNDNLSVNQVMDILNQLLRHIVNSRELQNKLIYLSQGF